MTKDLTDMELADDLDAEPDKLALGQPLHPNGEDLMENVIMPDDIETEISRMAQKLMALVGAESEVEAILGAVRFQLRCLENPKPIFERLKPVLERADALGPGDPEFDMKAYLDEMWGED